MANLLTPEYKKNLRRRDILKIVYIYLVGVGVILILAAIFLVPSFLLAGSKRLTAKENLDLLSASISSKESAEFGELLKETNAKIEVLSEEEERIFIHEKISDIVEAKPRDISLNSFSFRRSEGSLIAAVSGFALSRADLLSFSENLKSLEEVSAVDLPIATLANDRDVSFDISITFNSPAGT